MKITKILNYGIIASVVVSTLSFFLKIIPCQTAQKLANPDFKWGICKLPNPFSTAQSSTLTKFLGLSSDPLATLVTIFLAVFIITFLILNFSKKKREKVVDLTKK